ncbi:MAG: FkbM family methyltransferase [Planctomycetota bacterium]|jgi:FkbM family methyltransferase
MSVPIDQTVQQASIPAGIEPSRVPDHAIATEIAAATRTERLAARLAELGRDATVREAVLEVLRRVERTWSASESDVRGRLTGPLADALLSGARELTVELVNGLIYHYLPGSRIARAVALRPRVHPDHIWEPQTTRLLVHLAAGCDEVVVGGAYAGDHVLLIAQRLHERGGRCHAFEPNARQAAMLRRNLRVNRLDNVVVNELGLLDESGRSMRLVGDDSDACGEALAPGEIAGDDTFTTVTIDDYGEARGLDRIGLIMLDIEGAEAAALRGAERYLGQPPGVAPALVFEIHRHYVDWSEGLDRTSIVRFLAARGYHCMAIRDIHANHPMGQLPIELVRPEDTWLEGPPHGFNMLAVKDPALLRSDLFRVCRDVSPKLLPHRDPARHHPLDGWWDVSGGVRGTGPSC